MELDTIVCGDCLDVMRDMEDGCVDLVVTDPPYSLASASSRRSADKAMGWADINNASVWFSLWYKEVWRILKQDGAFWTFCSWHSAPVVQCATSHVPGMHLTSMLVWDKQWPGVGSTKGLRQHYEHVALAAKPDFAIKDRTIGDIWPCKWSSARPNGHPAEKPESLINQIIQVCEVSTDAVIFDPFIGSGTTAVAALKLGRHFYGCDINPDYVKLANERIEKTRLEMAQMELQLCD